MFYSEKFQTKQKSIFLEKIKVRYLKLKKIILTIDYELYLGVKTGRVSECMIEPTEKLASILEKNGSKMTVFWDILHYYRLLELEEKYSELMQDRLLIDEQILDLVGRGHDIQLHLHPHWLDAKYEDGKWNFTYDRYRLHSLLSENKVNDINTIIGCVSISKKIMENLIKKVNPDHKITTFRAGGHLIEPFNKIREALLLNEIKIDSSVCPELIKNSMISSFDFRGYPNKTRYIFDVTPREITVEGNFIEVPINTIRLPVVRNIYYKLLKKMKYPSIGSERRGSGVGDIKRAKQQTKFKQLFSILFVPQETQFTTDSNFNEKFDYLYKKAPDHATMILHPKELNSRTLEILDDYVTTKKILFISIKNFLD